MSMPLYFMDPIHFTTYYYILPNQSNICLINMLYYRLVNNKNLSKNHKNWKYNQNLKKKLRAKVSTTIKVVLRTNKLSWIF